MRILLLIVISFFVFTTSAFAEEIQFEIYQVDRNGTHNLIVSDKKNYSASDFLIHPEYRNNIFYGTKKELKLTRGFTIGIIENYEHPLTGFGLWINRISIVLNPNNFSWEWFDKVSNNHFIKLQGRTPIEIETKMISLTQEELLKVTFPADTKMEYKEKICNDKTKEKRKYLIIIKAGSILALPSISPNKFEERNI